MIAFSKFPGLKNGGRLNINGLKCSKPQDLMAY